MAKSKVYLNKARDFAASALLADDAGRRAALLQIAQHWRDLATLVEKHAEGRDLARLTEDPDRTQPDFPAKRPGKSPSKSPGKSQPKSQANLKRKPDR